MVEGGKDMERNAVKREEGCIAAVIELVHSKNSMKLVVIDSTIDTHHCYSDCKKDSMISEVVAIGREGFGDETVLPKKSKSKSLKKPLPVGSNSIEDSDRIHYYSDSAAAGTLLLLGTVEVEFAVDQSRRKEEEVDQEEVTRKKK